MPLIIRGPGIRGGRTSGEMAGNLDLAATVLDVTGAKPSRSVDGRSLIPYARKPSKRTRRPVLHEVGPAGYRAVRTSRYLWVEYSDGSRELYDLARDPYQLRLPPRRPALRAHPRDAGQGAQAPGGVQGEELPQVDGAHPAAAAVVRSWPPGSALGRAAHDPTRLLVG